MVQTYEWYGNAQRKGVRQPKHILGPQTMVLGDQLNSGILKFE